MSEIAAIVARLDGEESESFNSVQIFKLKNSLAEDLAPVLQDAITGQMYGQRTGQRTLFQGAGTGERFERKSVRLQFGTIDENGPTRLNSGLLTDAQVTADVRANALIVTASADSMPLIEALIKELDRLPTAEAQVKVFTVVHGDASNLLEMLDDLFGAQTQGADLAVRTGATGEDSSLVFLRFAVDVRTNSIIATGSEGDLEVVEGILATLDTTDLRERQTVVMRLKNAFSVTVAEAVNAFLETELEAQQPVDGLLSSIEQIDREVVIVPEEVTNSLIISATERYFSRITELVEKIDARPPMVLIQVLIASVRLNETDEFGIELGLQDSILFDRSVAGIPGFLFNSTANALGNNTAAPDSNIVGTQGLSNLSVGRSNSELGYGGLVISASSEAVSVLLRALQEERRLDVLGRPQIMTSDTVTASILVGEEVRIPSGTSTTEFGTVNLNTEMKEVGLYLEVTPRVSPDGQVIMEILTWKSQLGGEDQGTVISVSAQGQAFRSPRIEKTEAETTVSAMDGQTVILGGLITKERSQTHRQVPWLGDVPFLGNLFRFDSVREEKTELLIILTPHIVESLEDAELAKQAEAARVEWCYGDVLELHGDIFDRSGQAPVFYPDVDPHGQGFPRSSEDSPFIMEPLPSDPAEEQPSPAQPMPALGEQGAAAPSGRTSDAVTREGERRRGSGLPLSARRGSPDPAAAQPGPLPTSLTSGVE
ncbi:MAG: secretin N-terminal domain-containing protein, partial [Planctomycetota bacterium]